MTVFAPACHGVASIGRTSVEEIDSMAGAR